MAAHNGIRFDFAVLLFELVRHDMNWGPLDQWLFVDTLAIQSPNVVAPKSGAMAASSGDDILAQLSALLGHSVKRIRNTARCHRVFPS